MSERPADTATTEPHHYGDDPLTDESEDLLNRAPFADRAAQIIQMLPTQSSSAVVALVGPWGSGKTSVINFMLARLRESPFESTRFNPWVAGDTPSLIQEFFQSLASVLPEGSSGAWRETLAGYAQAAMPLAAVVKVFGPDATGVLEKVAGIGGRSLDQQRQELEEQLLELNQPVLVVLDDIDRLQTDELMAVFKLVRLVGRLPNVHYLLAFDEQSVINTIAASGVGSFSEARARSYLEKMVQVRLDLPPLDERAAGQLLEVHLDALLQRLQVHLEDDDMRRLGEGYRTYLSRLLQQPRQVERLCAQVEAQLALVRNEVDFVDFFIVAFLRLFRPGIVEALRSNKPALTGTAITYGQEITKEQQLAEWVDILRRAGVPDIEHEPLLELLGQLFPPLANLSYSMAPSALNESHTKKRRIGSAEYFDRFITLGIGPADIDDTFVNNAVRDAMTATEIPVSWETLTDLVSEHSETILDKARRIESSGQEAARLLPRAAAWQPRIPDDAGFLGRARIIHEHWCALLALRATSTDPAQLVDEIVRSSSIAFAARTYSTAIELCNEDGTEPDDSFREAAETTAERLRKDLEAKSIEPFDYEILLITLMQALEIIDPEFDLKAWIQDLITDRERQWTAIDVASCFVGRSTVVGGSGEWRLTGDFNTELAERYVGLAFLAQHAIDSPEEPKPERDVEATPEVRRSAAVYSLREWRKRQPHWELQ